MSYEPSSCEYNGDQYILGQQYLSRVSTMYTGITQGLFPATDLKSGDYHISFKISLSEILSQNLNVGDSISIDGVCHTVEKVQGRDVFFTSGAETLSKTTLKFLESGQEVSIERSAKIGQEIGGHLMSGHVFGMGVVVGSESLGPNLWLAIEVSEEMMPYIFEKGFIGVNGCSLTINRVNQKARTFELNLIPQTLALTAFSQKKLGDLVNIELDSQTVTIVQTVRRILDSGMNMTVD